MFLLSWVAPGRERRKKNFSLSFLCQFFCLQVAVVVVGSFGRDLADGYLLYFTFAIGSEEKETSSNRSNQNSCKTVLCFPVANCREKMETTVKAGYLQSHFNCVGMDSYDEREFFLMFWPRSHWPLYSYIRGSSGSGPTSVWVCESRNPQYVDVGIELWWQLTGKQSTSQYGLALVGRYPASRAGTPLLVVVCTGLI